jgi:hypothetical protein
MNSSSVELSVFNKKEIERRLNPHLLNLNILDLKGTYKTLRMPAMDLLLKWQRFDILAKYIYALHKLGNIESNWGKFVYLEHLRVFNGGVETDGNGKDGYDKFVQSFDSLNNSMKDGFSSEISLVPIGIDGVIIDGAHRVAAAAARKLTVDCVQFDYEPAKYDSHFFLSKGLDAEVADAIALEYCRLCPNTHIVSLFPSACKKDEEVVKILREHGNIYYNKNVKFGPLGQKNLIIQMYAKEPWLGTWENDFSGAMRKAAPCFSAEGPVRIFVFEAESLQNCKIAKEKIRNLYHIGNDSVHINDSHEETVRLAQIFFNENTIHFTNAASLKKYEIFGKLINDLKNWMARDKVSSEFISIDGSAVMSAYGLRDCADIDMLHLCPLVNPPAGIGSHLGETHWYNKNVNELVLDPRNFFYYSGLKFTALPLLRMLKASRAEEKDIIDIKLIDGLFAANNFPKVKIPLLVRTKRWMKRHSPGAFISLYRKLFKLLKLIKKQYRVFSR